MVAITIVNGIITQLITGGAPPWKTPGEPKLHHSEYQGCPFQRVCLEIVGPRKKNPTDIFVCIVKKHVTEHVRNSGNQHFN